MSKVLGAVEGLGAAGCFVLGALALPSVAGSVPLFGLGLVLVHGAEQHLAKPKA